MTLRKLYELINREPAKLSIDLEGELAKQNKRRRRAVEMRCEGYSLRDIGHRLKISHGSAASLIKLTLRAIRKSLLDLPRYHLRGHPGVPPHLRYVPRPKPKRGRPPSQRCPCGAMTAAMAAKYEHRCRPYKPDPRGPL